MTRNFTEIKEIKTGLTELFATFHSQVKTQTEYYDQNISLGDLPPKVEIYRSPSFRSAIDSAVDHLMTLAQVVTVPIWNENEEDKKYASKLERFGDAFLQLIESTQRSVRRNCKKNGILYGLFALKGPLYVPRFAPAKTKGQSAQQYMDSSAYKDFEKSLELTFPFAFRSTHPLNIMFDMSDNPQFVIETYSRKAITIQQNWPEWTMAKKGGGKFGLFDDVEWWEFYSPEQIVYVAADEVVKDDANDYGFIPYQIGNAGFGIESAEGNPADIYVGMLAAALSSYKLEQRIKTAILAGLEQGVYGKWVVEQTPGADFILTQQPGEVSVIPSYYKAQNLAPTAISPDAYRWLGLVDSDQQAVMPKQLMGMPTSGLSSGVQEMSRTGQAKLRLEGCARAWENCIGKTLDNVLLLTKNVVKESIGIMGSFQQGKSIQTIDPARINTALQRFYVKLDAETPEEKQARIMLGRNLAGDLSWETRCEKFFGEDPEVERQRLLIEEALKSPLIREQLAMQAIKDAGMNEVLNALGQGQLGYMNQGQPSQMFQGGKQPLQLKENLNQNPNIQQLGTPPEQMGAGAQGQPPIYNQ